MAESEGEAGDENETQKNKETCPSLYSWQIDSLEDFHPDGKREISKSEGPPHFPVVLNSTMQTINLCSVLSLVSQIKFVKGENKQTTTKNNAHIFHDEENGSTNGKISVLAEYTRTQSDNPQDILSLSMYLGVCTSGVLQIPLSQTIPN
ncbi:uncharacterized protein LOC108590610 [Callithrix jacchus]